MRTIAFPYTPDMAGHVYAYDITPQLADQWEALTRLYARQSQSLPYYNLAQAFRFVLGDFAAVRRGPDNTGTLVLVREPIPNDWLPRLFRSFEMSLARRHNATFADTLVPLLAGIEPRKIILAEHLDGLGPTGEPDIANWVFDVAIWHVIELLTKNPLTLPDGRTLRLRPDIDGNLLAWDDLLPGAESRGEKAMHYLSLTPITVPGHPRLVLNLDAHVSRLTNFLGDARTIWIAPSPDQLVLTGGLQYDRKTKKNLLKGALAELVDSFSLKGIPTEFTSQDLTDKRDLLRARYYSTPARHPVGSGPGRKFLDLVLDHAAAHLVDSGTHPLDLVDSKIRGGDRRPAAAKATAPPTDRIPLAATLAKSRVRLHLTVLYATDQMRARAATAIAIALDTAPGALGAATQSLLEDRLTVSFTYASRTDLLEPGDVSCRSGIADDVARQVPEGWLGVVLAETSRDLATSGPATPSQDPKPQLRQVLAAHGLVSQFLDSASAAKPDATDHAANNALLDLLRTAGLTGTIPARVFARPLQAGPAVFVGIHTRVQNNPACRMISLAAVVTDGTDKPWEVLAYHPDAKGWQSYPVAVAAHHATMLSPFDKSMTRDHRDAAAGAYAQRALEQLLLRYPELPIVVFVDGVGGRAIWPGLSNRLYGLTGAGSLPHLGLSNALTDQIALIRVNTGDDGELIQPVRDVARTNEDDAFVPASTKLYRLDESKRDVFYLVNRSRSDQSYDFAVRDSHRKTRFELDGTAKAMRTPWHALTCSEFAIIDSGRFTVDQLAALAARFCGHPLAWDGRTTRPMPQHLARQITEDHPGRVS